MIKILYRNRTLIKEVKGAGVISCDAMNTKTDTLTDTHAVEDEIAWNARMLLMLAIMLVSESYLFYGEGSAAFF
jgi:hypothetical protein